MRARRAVVAGSTGLVGSHLVELLLASPAVSGVDVLVRRPAAGVFRPGGPGEGASGAGGAGKVTSHVVDFETPASFPHVRGAFALFCALGTTIRKAGSPEAFRRVDHDYVLAAARWGVEQGIDRFLLVTAVGSDARSPALYPRVKGEVEEAVRGLPFRAVHIFRPSFLVGERAESRPGESLGIAAATFLSPLLRGGLRKYRPVPARAVAAAMLRVALEGPEGAHVHESDEIRSLAGLG